MKAVRRDVIETASPASDVSEEELFFRRISLNADVREDCETMLAASFVRSVEGFRLVLLPRRKNDETELCDRNDGVRLVDWTSTTKWPETG